MRQNFPDASRRSRRPTRGLPLDTPAVFGRGRRVRLGAPPVVRAPGLHPNHEVNSEEPDLMRPGTRSNVVAAALLAVEIGSGGIPTEARPSHAENPGSSVSLPEPCIHHGTYSNGSLTGDSSLPNQGVGYYHDPGEDRPDTDDWACSHWLIARIQMVGQQWNRSPRVGILDLSLMGGGRFPPHKSHQNGLDVDVRYVGNGGYEGPIAFGSPSERMYDMDGTQRLVDIFCKTGAVRIYVDSRARLSGSCIRHESGHHNHFHVRYPAP